jgi:hypothetical protein
LVDLQVVKKKKNEKNEENKKSQLSQNWGLCFIFQFISCLFAIKPP